MHVTFVFSNKDGATDLVFVASLLLLTMWRNFCTDTEAIARDNLYKFWGQLRHTSANPAWPVVQRT